MTDFILQSDPIEFQNSRQSTKIIFLQNEIKQLQDYIKDLEQVVRINKEALKIATGQQSQANLKKKAFSSNDTNSSTADTSSTRGDHKNLHLLIEQLQEENLKLLDIIEKIKKERNVALSKALISEQICEEAQRHETEAVAELEEKIHELRKLVQDKEYTIQELEKIKPLPEHDGIIIKYREIINPTEQNIKLHNELDAVNAMLAKVAKELNSVTSEKQELATINFAIKNELAQLRAAIVNPSLIQKLNGVKPDENLTANFGIRNRQNQFQVQQNYGMEDDSPFPSPLPDKVGGGLPAIMGLSQLGGAGSKAPVPKLDLTKAKQIQDQNAKKLNAQPAAPQNVVSDPKLLEKIKQQLESDLEVARKRLSCEMINNKLLADEIALLTRQNSQLASTNDLLLKSNSKYEEKWQKIFYSLEFYKEFYHKYIDMITNRRYWNKNNIFIRESVVRYKDRFNLDIDMNPEKAIKDLRKIDEENGKQVNISILEAEEGENFENERLVMEGTGNVMDFNKEQCKIFLLNLAKDVYVSNYVTKALKGKSGANKPRLLTRFAPNPAFKHLRSISNGLEYVSENKALIFEAPKDKEVAKLKRKGMGIRLADDQNDVLLKGGEIKITFQVPSPSPIKPAVRHHTFGDDGDMISFTVDPDDVQNKKLIEVSFISNNEILDQLKN